MRARRGWGLCEIAFHAWTWKPRWPPMKGWPKPRPYRCIRGSLRGGRSVAEKSVMAQICPPGSKTPCGSPDREPRWRQPGSFAGHGPSHGRVDVPCPTAPHGLTVAGGAAGGGIRQGGALSEGGGDGPGGQPVGGGPGRGRGIVAQGLAQPVAGNRLGGSHWGIDPVGW